MPQKNIKESSQHLGESLGNVLYSPTFTKLLYLLKV